MKLIRNLDRPLQLIVVALTALITSCSTCQPREQDPSIPETPIGEQAADNPIADDEDPFGVATDEEGRDSTEPDSPPGPVYYVAHDGEIHRILVEEQADEALGVHTMMLHGGSLGRGNSIPRLSPDGQHLAYLFDDDLWIARSDGTEQTRITSHNEGVTGLPPVVVLISGWSPDNRHLMFYLGEQQADDGPYFPEDLQDGFYLLSVDSTETQHLPWVRCFDTWSSSPRHFFCVESRGRQHQLIQQSIDSEETVILSPEAELFESIGQISVSGDRLAYGLGSQLLHSHPNGDDLTAVTPEGRWAQFQWPRLSPDLQHVAYIEKVRGDDVVVVTPASGSAPTNLRSCARWCGRPMWYGNDAVIVNDGDELWLIPLDGDGVRLAESGSLVR